MIAWLAAALLAQEADPPPEFTLAVQYRVSSMSRNNGLWEEGRGLTLEGSYLGRVKKWAMGGYLSVGYDRFEGLTSGDVETDDLLTSQVFLGFKTMAARDRGFFFDGRVGVGAFFWDGTDATVAGAPVTAVDSNTSFAVEFAPHIGYTTHGVFLAAGFALRFSGDGFAGSDLDLDTSLTIVASWEFELGFRF